MMRPSELVEQTLAEMTLEEKASILGGQDEWSLPAIERVGLRSLVWSDGPIGVRGVRWTPDDPSIALPSPTTLAATWNEDLAFEAGRLLAQEAHDKGVHVILAPTVNLHRSPLHGRHFESYSEDPLLTGRMAVSYVQGVQDGGIGTTVKHFVANEAETERFTVNNIVDARTLRELYLVPFEMVVKSADPWGLMDAYNSVNGPTMTEHSALQNGVLRDEWGYEGVIVSDWVAGRDTVGAITGGLDVAMPGPDTIFGARLVSAVENGEIDESLVVAAARRVLTLAQRVGALGDEAEGTVGPRLKASDIARRIAASGFVLLKNDAHILPLVPTSAASVAVIGQASKHPRILGGGAAQVFPVRSVSPWEGLQAAADGTDIVFRYSDGVNLDDGLEAARDGFELNVAVTDSSGSVIARAHAPSGEIQWAGSDLPVGATYEATHSVELSGQFIPKETGWHGFGTKAVGGLTLSVADQILFDGYRPPGDTGDPLAAYFTDAIEAGTVYLEAGQPAPLSLKYVVHKPAGATNNAVVFSLLHRRPRADDDDLIAEAVALAETSEIAIVVVATTERHEGEGADRKDLRLPGRQDELVARVSRANPNTVVVVNAGSPVEMPWRDAVSAILLTWFPGQEGGDALADVMFGIEEPGGRLPTTWPARLDDVPVSNVIPTDGDLHYEEGIFIGYRAWDRHQKVPAFPFGYGLGYTTWAYTDVEVAKRDGGGFQLAVDVTNTGNRSGREVVQVYISPTHGDHPGVERPRRWLAGFASVVAEPGERESVTIEILPRCFDVWDTAAGEWRMLPGRYSLAVSHDITDPRLVIEIEVASA